MFKINLVPAQFFSLFFFSSNTHPVEISVQLVFGNVKAFFIHFFPSGSNVYIVYDAETGNSDLLFSEQSLSL